MGTVHRPRRGSLAVAPRKRSKRIYPRVSSKRPMKDVKPLDFAGYKVGMTEVRMIDDRVGSPTHNQQVVVSATVIETPPLYATGVRAYRKHPYGVDPVSEIWAEQKKELSRKTSISKKKVDVSKMMAELEKKLEDFSKITLIVNTQPVNAGINKKKPELFESDLGGSVAEMFAYAKEHIGKEIPIKDVFVEGEYIDTVGVTVGKGFQGSVKRFGVKLLAKKSQKLVRKAGNLGPWHPHKVSPRVPQMGQMGFHKRTQFNNRILKIGEDPKEINADGWKRYGLVKGQYLLVRGSIQGPTKRVIRMRHALRSHMGKVLSPQIVSLKV